MTHVPTFEGDRKGEGGIIINSICLNPEVLRLAKMLHQHFRILCLTTLSSLCPSSNDKLSQYTGAVQNMDLKSEKYSKIHIQPSLS
jgi:hypothetical protein